MIARDYFTQLRSVYESQKDRLDDLDAAIGDGDHGSTMLRGLSAAANAEDGRLAKAFMRASGGASGTLFGLILHEIEIHLSGSDMTLALQLERALERIKTLGKVEAGDKSMVDALEPAVRTLRDGGSLADALEAAEAGREATRDMAARRGRAKYVENAGVGHVDPGAASVCLMLEALRATGER